MPAREAQEGEVLKCLSIDCRDNAKNWYKNTFFDHCEFHNAGGIFGTGESYEQYQIIESDFIDFIKVVPLTPEHYNVHSPILRDILIRTCVQIEVFFKEWVKLKCSENSEHSLWTPYRNKNGKGVRNWSFQDYFVFRPEFKEWYPIHVMPLNEKIFPLKIGRARSRLFGGTLITT